MLRTEHLYHGRSVSVALSNTKNPDQNKGHLDVFVLVDKKSA